MGAPHSKPEDRLRYILKEVSSIKTGLRTSSYNITQDKKEHLAENLAHYSGEVSSMNGKIKRKHIDEALKNISETLQELLKIDPNELDRVAVESDSFVNVPLGQRRSSSLGSLRSSKKNPKNQIPVNRSSIPTLRDIEAKVGELRTQVNTAITNRDTKQLRVHQQTVKVLAADLELIHTEKNTPIEKRKESLDKKIVSLYQRTTRALNELKRDDNIRNQSKQYRKERAMQELTDVEIHVAENESLLDKLIKEKNSQDFAVIRNNIVKNNQNLAKIDIVDNEVKEKVILLSQKLTENVRNLDRIMAKREFDSKFSKCFENYERAVRNFDARTNAEDTISNLKSIRNSIEHLEELNDTTKSRKNELLQNITHHIQDIEELIPKTSDQKIVEEIVEDNVVLRKKVKSSDKEHTVIDQFIAYWNNVKTNFDVNKYSNLSLLRIDSVLEEMQESINDIRVGIAHKCDTKPPTNLIRKRSQSVPRLNTKKGYGSNQSLDQVEKIIKTKAKVYNMSTPDLQNVGVQQQAYANNRFSKIEEIKLQVHYIKEKIDQSHNKNLLREKLEQYRRTLGEYTSDPNKTVSNNAILVSNEIIELLYKIALADYRERLDVLVKKVYDFNGTRYDKEFDEIKDGLVRIQVSLETFNIPVQYKYSLQEKGELLDEVFNSIETLQEKGTSFRKHENDNAKDLKVKLQVLSDKVKRFSGTYKGVMYNNIERDLNKILLDAGEKVEDKVWSNEITKETERLLKILEQRSSLAQSFRISRPEETKTDEQVGMIKIKRDLFNIKREIDRTSENNVEAFIGLQSRLDLVNFELSQISTRSDENLAKEKDIFSNETETLKNVVDAKIALGQQPMVQWPERDLQANATSYPKNDVNSEIEQFENAFISIKNEISAPTSEQDVHKFYTLTQDVKSLIDKLSNYRFIRGTDLHTRQSNLLNEMQYYLEALEKGAVDTDYVLSIEKTIEKIEKNFKQQYDLNTMAKELQAMQKKLEEHRFNTGNDALRDRKTSVQQKTEDLVQKLKKREEDDRKREEYITKLEEAEKKIDLFTPQVSSFTGLKEDSKYHEISEVIVRAILELDKMDEYNGDLQKRRMGLLKELHLLGQALDDRAQQTEEIVNIETDLDEFSGLLNNFSGKDEELRNIRNKTDAIKRQLNGLKVVNNLITRKNACTERFSSLFYKSMTLSASPSRPSLLSAIEQSTGFSSKSSSVYTTSTEQTSSGYTSHVYSFTANSPQVKIQNGNDTVLMEIDKGVDKIAESINTTNDANKLQELDDILTQYTIKIGKLKYTKDSPQYPFVVDLFRKIESLTDIIEEKMQDHDILNGISNEVDDISSKMDTPLTYQQIDQVHERLIQLQVTLGKMKNDSLKAQIDGCMMRIIMCLQKISEFRASVQTTAV